MSEFSQTAYCRGGYNNYCKRCQSLYVRKTVDKPHKEGKKTCNTCKEEREYKFFSRSKTGIDGYVVRCKICQAEARKRPLADINYAEFYYPIRLD
jgi:hypothetical protein